MDQEFKKFVFRFLRKWGLKSEDVPWERLPGDGSNRVFWRIADASKNSSLIALSNPADDNATRRENVAYLKIGRHLHGKGIPVAEIYSYDLERGFFVMEDMGRTSLQDVVSSGHDYSLYYKMVLEKLFHMQEKGADGFDTKWCCQTERYDSAVMYSHESIYFRDAFLCNFLGLKRSWRELEKPFWHLAETASMAENNFFLHRDFQSRNIMTSKGNIGFIDWQGGRLGPLGYDLASLIIDPYTDLSTQDKEKIYRSYLSLIEEKHAGWIESFKKYFPYLAIQRNLQILGAFSFLSKKKGKKYFEVYIPPALKNLHELLFQLNDSRLSTLKDLINELHPLKNPST